MTVKLKAYSYTLKLFSAIELAGIIKFHPQELEPIKYLVYPYAWKIIENYVKFDENISDDKYLLFVKSLEENLIKAKIESENDTGLFENTDPDYIKTKELVKPFIESDSNETSELILHEAQNPGLYINVYSDLGWAYKKELSQDKAVAAFTRAIKLAHSYKKDSHSKTKIDNKYTPNDPSCYYNWRAGVYREMGDLSKAIADMDKALEMNPHNVCLLDIRAGMYETAGEYKKAHDDWEKALKIKREKWAAESEEGDYVSRLEKSTFEKYIMMSLARCNSNNAGSCAAGTVKPPLVNKKEDQKKCSYCSAALGIETRYGYCVNCGKYISVAGFASKEDLYLNGLKMFGLCDDENDIKIFSEFITLNDNNLDRWTCSMEKANSYFRRGLAYREIENYDEAAADFTRALELEPKNYYFYSERADVYRKNGKYDQAIADFTAALDFKPKDFELFEKRADAYRKNRQYSKAIADLSKAIELSNDYAESGKADDEFSFLPGPSYYLELRARVHIDMGEFDKAFADMDEALETNPSDFSIYEFRAEVFETIGEYKKALDDWKKALVLHRNEWASEEEDDSEFFNNYISGVRELCEEYLNMNIERCMKKLGSTDIQRFKRNNFHTSTL